MDTQTKVKKWKTQWDEKPLPKGQHVEGESMTVPDQTFTVREILTRFRRSPIEVGVNPNLEYTHDDGSEDFDQPMAADIEDLVDAQIAGMYAKEVLTKHEKSVQEKEAAKRVKLAAQELEQKVQEEIERRAKTGGKPLQSPEA